MRSNVRLDTKKNKLELLYNKARTQKEMKKEIKILFRVPSLNWHYVYAVLLELVKKLQNWRLKLLITFVCQI